MKFIVFDRGRHANGIGWFSLFVNLGRFASFFFSWKTQAYDTAYQSGIGHVIRWPFSFAEYLSILEYPTGTRVVPHHDGDLSKQKSIACININIVLKKAEAGGKFICPQALLNTERLKIFNGDKYFHEVTPVEKGKRILLAYKFSLSKKRQA